MRRLARVFFGVVLTALGTGASVAAEPITVFAAASLTDSLEAAGRAYRAKTGTPVRYSFASSSALARQIEQGAPAQIFASADETWMTYLEQRGLIEPATRVSPIGNRLVLIAPAANTLGTLAIDSSLDLVRLLGPNGRLSTGDPVHVPVGTYAKEALRTLGLWAAVEKRIAPAENVRVALALVERGEAPLGIVYATDATVAKGVKIVGEFPASVHTPITYPFALIAGKATPDARTFFAFLTGEEGQRVFHAFGFPRD